MIRPDLYSIRMRASDGTRHVSGAERIVASGRIAIIVQELVERAAKSGAVPEHIEVKIDAIGAQPIRLLQSLPIVTNRGSGATTARAAACHVLLQLGISNRAAEEAIRLLINGPSAVGTMRGAVLMDGESAERLEPDQQRGIRASRFDWYENEFTLIGQKLTNIGLTHHRTREALALATKIAHGPGVLAELCWSDDPDYTAGYVASLVKGYVRFPVLKDRGEPRGGRVIFVDRTKLDLGKLVQYLQTEPVLITAAGECRLEREPDV